MAFTCVFNGAKGHLDAKVVAPSGAEDEALVQSLDDTQGMLSPLILSEPLNL